MKSRIKHIAGIIYQNLELISWIVILVALFLPMPMDQHFTLCPLQNMGFEHCPGCGLGRSSHLALHGNIAASLSMHPFGIFAVVVILYRIYSLILYRINHFKTKAL